MLQRELWRVKFELLSIQAIVHQYRNKSKNIRKLAMASIDCDGILMEYANEKVEDGKVPNKMKSDCEDEHPHNQTVYTYIDNQLFMNEM